eukprot:CAMPEP_0197012702 /NCGR_PEP_ID=MMETSP1380-20130617/63410_1 /TAXON_ID=5936 /ORGANISM="Euplotes crassus, Strain CT5" /LENGTH=342 /DNA_ID=CAMNT_0042436377 /DNA_START=126 /DNA_END=1154 /DNA_ORIENTATION=-
MNTQFSRAMFSGRFGHQVRNEILFRSDNNNHSRRSQKGLYHGKTHGPKFKVCFSDKRHRYTQKPNVFAKKFYSDILEMELVLPVTVYAFRIIRKYKSFDNYILKTKEKDMNSKMGMHLKELMLKKLKDPKFVVPYIPFQYKVKKGPRRRPRYLETLPTVYIPVHMQQTEDFTKWHDKLPSEMTRDEIADFEALMKDPDFFELKSEDWKKKQPEYIRCREELLKLQPMRHDIIRKYWELNKNSEEAKYEIVRMADETEDFTKKMLGDDYIHYKDAIPEIPEFLERMEFEKKLAIHNEKKTKLGEIHLRIGTKYSGFNPFEGKPKHPNERHKKIRKEWKPAHEE